MRHNATFHQGLHCYGKKDNLTKNTLRKKYNPTPKNFVSNQKEESVCIQFGLNRDLCMCLYKTHRQMTFHLLTDLLDGQLYSFEGSEVAILKLKIEDWFLLDK